MKVLRSRTGEVLFDQVCVADKTLSRMRGLIGKRELGNNEGMFFPECRMIHTCFMSMAIDVLFLDDKGEVLDVFHEVKPWRMAGCRESGGRHTLELACGICARLGIKKGDSLDLSDSPKGEL